MRFERSILLTLLVLWLLVFFGHSWEPGLKMDAMTYSALAKHILATGDWRTLHYTPSAYGDFYQHPPLAIWLQALVFKVVGATDLSARLVPALFGLGTLLGLLTWGTVAGSAWWGFLASVVLLTSGRYVKFATDFFLDGPLACWLVWGSLCLFLAESPAGPRRRARTLLAGAGYGLALAGALLTKGVIALSLPLAGAGYALYRRLRGGSRANGPLLAWLTGSAAAAVPILAWIYLGGGEHYLVEYWRQSVGGRIGNLPWEDHLKPAAALLKTYWPWLPVLLWGVLRAARGLVAGRAGAAGGDVRANAGALALLHAGVLFGAFTFVGHYLDHYLVPFYPFAALVAAYPMAEATQALQPAISRVLRNAALALAVMLAVFPVPLHYPRGEPLRSFLNEAERVCHGQREFLITGAATERWMALAVALWTTPREATSIDAPAPPADPRQLLVTAANEPVPAGWEPVALGSVALGSAPLRLYRPARSGLCQAD